MVTSGKVKKKTSSVSSADIQSDARVEKIIRENMARSKDRLEAKKKKKQREIDEKMKKVCR